MFLISKCRGDSDLGLCKTSGLAFGEPMRSGDFGKKNVFRRRKIRILPLRCGKFWAKLAREKNLGWAASTRFLKKVWVEPAELSFLKKNWLSWRNSVFGTSLGWAGWTRFLKKIGGWAGSTRFQQHCWPPGAPQKSFRLFSSKFVSSYRMEPYLPTKRRHTCASKK